MNNRQIARLPGFNAEASLSNYEKRYQAAKRAERKTNGLVPAVNWQCIGQCAFAIIPCVTACCEGKCIESPACISCLGSSYNTCKACF
jgi:hypothetical protein